MEEMVTCESEQSASDMSPTVGKLAAALAKCQGSMGCSLKNSENPSFESRYADLAAVWDACRVPLSENELSIVQPVRSLHDGRVVVATVLLHSSGEWMGSTLTLTPKDRGPQALGSCITYGRRYGLSAMVGVAAADDDAESAEGRNRPPAGKSVSTGDAIDRIANASDMGELAQVASWMKGQPEAVRNQCRSTYLARKRELGGSGKEPV